MIIEDTNTAAPAADADDTAGMDAAIAAATETEAVATDDVAVEPAATEATDDAATDEAAADEAEGDTAQADEEAAEGDKADEPKAEDDKPAEEAADPIDAEAKALGLKEKAAERFRELSREREEMAPLREAMKAAGLADVQQAARALERVRDADYVLGRVVDTGANHEQFDSTLNYLALVNKGDTASLEQAWALIEPEIKLLAQALGKDVPGMVDPLAGHADLIAEVEAGDLPRARALEIAAALQRSAHDTAVRQSAQQREQAQREAQQQAEQAAQHARSELNSLGNDLAAADPARFQALQPQLVALVQQVAAQHPPHEWAYRVARAYATLPYAPPAPPAAKPPIGHVPMRATGARAPMAPAHFDDPDEAMEFGIAQASR